MAIPFLERRRERKQLEIAQTVEDAVGKALSPAVAQAAAHSGATYPVNPSDPFAQTGGYGGSYVPLPRGDGVFDSLFGPGTPLVPDPLDALRPDGRVQARRGQYPVTINVNLLDREVPWSHLKWMARNCDVIARCIELVQDGMVGREWSWGFSDDILNQIMTESGESNHARAMAIAKEKYGTELDSVKQFFKKPDLRSNHIFSQFLSEIIWQALVYDGVAIYPQFTLGGDLYSLSPVDTSTIKILLDNQGFPPEPPAPAYQQILYGFPRGEFQAQDGPDVQGEYLRDQLAYYIRRPRPESVYGFSPVEECMYIAQTYLERQAWMRAEYTAGSTPKTYFKVAEGSTWTPEQNETFELHLNDRLAGQNRRRQMGFLLPNGITPEQMKQVDETYKNDYDNFLITQIGSKFGVPATQLGVQAKAGLSGGKQMEGESGQTEQFVFNAIINFFVDILNDLARRYLGVGPEITATCQDPGDNEENILQQSQADTQDVNNGRLTLNDWRAKRGLPLYDMPEADEPFIASAQGPVFLKGTLAVQDAQTENTLNPPEPPKQVMVGPDGKPLPNQGSTDGGSDTSANGGLQSVSSGTGTSQDKSDGSSGPSGASGSSDQSDKVDDDGNSTASAAPADTKSSDESGASKELAAFVRFAKGRIDRGTWRDFDFTTIESVRARRLNEYGRLGQLDLIKADSDSLPFAAGIIVKARDTQRVLLVQRAIDNQNVTAAGLWEIPGGKLDGADDAFKAAKREWQEETGIKLPDGDLFDSFTSQNGRYTTFIWMIDHESDIELENARGLDGSGDNEVENVAWWNINDLQNNPAVRAELQSIDWATLAHAKSTKKALAQKAGQTTRKWQDHPNNALHDQIVAHYAPLLVQAFKDSVHGVHEAIAEAKRKASNAKNDNSAKSLAKAGVDDAQDAVNANVTMRPEDVADVLRQMIGDAYLAGSHNAAAMVGGGAKVLESLEGANTAMDWGNWRPGWLSAAGNVRDGGLADLLSQSMATIQGIQGTALTRLGNVLADGIAGGDSVQTIASNMTGFALTPDRAMVIANTETARSMVSATLSTYDQNGVASWEWIAEDDACPECDELDGQSFNTANSNQDPPPLHPSCRCATLPNVAGQDTTQPTLDSGEDDS